MAFQYFISELITFLTLIAGILLILLLGIIFFNRNEKNTFGDIKEWFKNNSLWVGLVVTLVATLGSLFYSNVMGYTPCQLCWFQRIFMYPLPLIFAIAILKKDFGVKSYIIPMSIIGGAISIFHYIQQIIEKSVGCDVGSAADCAVKYTFDYGYITIPMMALTAFLWVLTLMIITRSSKEKKPEKDSYEIEEKTEQDISEEETKVPVKKKHN